MLMPSEFMYLLNNNSLNGYKVQGTLLDVRIQWWLRLSSCPQEISSAHEGFFFWTFQVWDNYRFTCSHKSNVEKTCVPSLKDLKRIKSKIWSQFGFRLYQTPEIDLNQFYMQCTYVYLVLCDLSIFVDSYDYYHQC